jgi:hypothetical protein
MMVLDRFMRDEGRDFLELERRQPGVRVARYHFKSFDLGGALPHGPREV